MNVQGKVWGNTCQLFNRNNVELHYVNINAGGYCSKHLHRFKFNKFVVLSGKLKVTVWNGALEDVTILLGNQECTVPPNTLHRFEALEDTLALEIYWTELDANDIVRIDTGGTTKDAPSPDIRGFISSPKCYNIGESGTAHTEDSGPLQDYGC